MRRLIVNADDFGLTAGVNAAILELYAARALTSTTLMATAAEFPSAVTASIAARETFGRPREIPLGIGCHIVLVDGTPCLPPEQIPSLIDRSSPAGGKRFRRTLGQFVLDLLRGKIRESDIESEALAQIRRLQSNGIEPTHLDTHKHTHMFGGVLRPLLRAATRSSIRAIRNPFEPQWSTAATAGAGLIRTLEVRALRTQRHTFLKAAALHGIATTDGAIGVLATGTLDALTLRNLLSKLPEGTWELVTHPGYRDAALEFANTRLLRSREIERSALLEILPAAAAASLEFISFRELNVRDGSAQLDRAQAVGNHATR